MNTQDMLIRRSTTGRPRRTLLILVLILSLLMPVGANAGIT